MILFKKNLWTSAPWAAPWGSIWPSSGVTVAVTVIAGTVSGSSNAVLSQDGTEYHIAEEVATPGFDTVFTFSGVTTAVNLLSFYGFYDGNVGHTVNINALNYNTSSYDTVGTLPYSAVATEYSFNLVDADHRSASGEVKIQIVHPGPGNINHTLHIDYLMPVYFMEILDALNFFDAKPTLDSGTKYLLDNTGVLRQHPADVLARGGLRYDAGSFYITDASGDPLYASSQVDTQGGPVNRYGAVIPVQSVFDYWPGGRIEGPATNFLLNSQTPATQTTGSLGTGIYCLWIEGTGSVAVAGNTATITGAGSATEGTPVVFTVTAAGTVDVTVTGTVDFFQLENNGFPTSHIPTTTGTAPRISDIATHPWPTGLVNDFWIEMELTPLGAGQNSTFAFSVYSSSTSRYHIYFTNTAVHVYKFKDGETTVSNQIVYTHTTNRFTIQVYQSSNSGMGIRLKEEGGAWLSWSFNASYTQDIVYYSTAVFGRFLDLGLSLFQADYHYFQLSELPTTLASAAEVQSYIEAQT